MEHSTGGNMFDSHPMRDGSIFQIDGNFGAAAAIAEMLLQSHEEQIAFLPALPSSWPRGEVRGLRTRGGLEVDIDWKDGAPSEAKLHGLRSGEHKLRAPSGYRIAAVKTSSGKSVPLQKVAANDSAVSQLNVDAGTTYVLQFVKS